MPKAKKKPVKEESEDEEEEEEQEENSDEEDEDKDEDEEEEEDEEKDEDEDEDPDKEEDEDDEDKSEKSDESDRSSDGSEKKKKKKKKKKDDSDDEDQSDDEGSEQSDDSGKKKKKKGKKKEDDKKKGKKGDKKGKKEHAIDDIAEAASKSAPVKALTIASVAQDLDELTEYLSKTFTYFKPDRGIRDNYQEAPMRRPQEPYYDVPRELNPQGSLHNMVHSPTAQFREATRNVYAGESNYGDLRDRTLKASPKHLSEPTYEHGHGYRNAKPLQDEKGIQYDIPPDRKQFSPEAKRAVQEYRERLEQEKKGVTYKDEAVGTSQVFAGSIKTNASRVREEHQGQTSSTLKYVQDEDARGEREERKDDREPVVEVKRRTYSPNRSGGQWSKSNQIAENYYAGLAKKNAREASPSKKTLQDLYKHKPKPMYVEGDSKPVERYSASEFNPQRVPNNYERYEQNFRQSGYSNKNQGVLDANKRQINEAMDVLMKKSKPGYSKY